MTTGMIIGRVRVRLQIKLESESRTALRMASEPLLVKLNLPFSIVFIMDAEASSENWSSMANETPRPENSMASIFLCLSGNGRDHTVVGELLAIAQDNGVGIADPQAVDVDDAGLDGCTALDDTTAHLERVAVIEDKDMIVLDAHLAGELGMSAQMHGLTVNRHKVRGFGHGHQELELLLATVTGDVDESAVLIPHVAAELGQAVDDLLDGLLVAGNGSC